MRQLVFACGGILALLLVGSALAVRLPPNQAVAFTLFGACLAGLLLFAWRISVEDKNRGHDH
jgi:uncharacterized membrane protein YfcA